MNQHCTAFTDEPLSNIFIFTVVIFYCLDTLKFKLRDSVILL